MTARELVKSALAQMDREGVQRVADWEGPMLRSGLVYEVTDRSGPTGHG